MDIKDLEKKLEDWYSDNCPVPRPYDEFFEELSKAVAVMIIEARIDEQDNHAICDCEGGYICTSCKRSKQLEQQKELLCQNEKG
jgi:hypothetical protein